MQTPSDLLLPGHLASAHPIDLTYLDQLGRRCGGGTVFDHDFGMELDLVPEGACSALQLVFEHQDVYWSFCLRADGHASLDRFGVSLAEFECPPLVAGKRVALAFGHLDGAFFVEADGKLLSHHAQELVEYVERPRFHGARNENLLHVGIAGAPAAIARLRVFRDLYYRGMPITGRAIDGPYELRPGEMFLLGDNSIDSQDSRMKAEDAQFKLADLIGRPLGVIGPWARRRWFAR